MRSSRPSERTGRSVREGVMAGVRGVPGVPRAAETIALERDLRLVALTGARYHAALVFQPALARGHDAQPRRRPRRPHSGSGARNRRQCYSRSPLRQSAPSWLWRRRLREFAAMDRRPSRIILSMEPSWLAAIASRCSRNPCFVFTHQPRRSAAKRVLRSIAIEVEQQAGSMRQMSSEFVE
jgi:hypothetical protein